MADYARDIHPSVKIPRHFRGWRYVFGVGETLNPYASNLEDFPTIVTAWFSYSNTPPPDALSSLIGEFGPEAVERAIISAGRGGQLHDPALLRRMAYLSRQFIELERGEA